MTLRELRTLGALRSVQGLIGMAMARNHDRNPNRYAEVMGYLNRAHMLCIEGSEPYTDRECIAAEKKWPGATEEETFI